MYQPVSLFTTTLGSGFCYNLSVSDEETEAQRNFIVFHPVSLGKCQRWDLNPGSLIP